MASSHSFKSVFSPCKHMLLFLCMQLLLTCVAVMWFLVWTERSILKLFPSNWHESVCHSRRFGDISLQERINQKNFEILDAYYKLLSEKVPVECKYAVLFVSHKCSHSFEVFYDSIPDEYLCSTLICYNKADLNLKKKEQKTVTKCIVSFASLNRFQSGEKSII